MSDWLERKKEEKARKEAEKITMSQQEQLIGSFKYQVFEVLQSVITERIQEYNQWLASEGKIRQGSKYIELGYENYTITGDHFMIQKLAFDPDALQMKVSIVKDHIKYELFKKSGKDHRSRMEGRYLRVSEGEIRLTIGDGKRLILRHEGQTLKIDGAAELILDVLLAESKL